jgi:hypothetical protein
MEGHVRLSPPASPLVVSPLVVRLSPLVVQIDCFSPAGKISPEKRRSIFRFPAPYSVMRSREVGATVRRKAEQTDMTLKACSESAAKQRLFV